MKKDGLGEVDVRIKKVNGKQWAKIPVVIESDHELFNDEIGYVFVGGDAVAWRDDRYGIIKVHIRRNKK